MRALAILTQRNEGALLLDWIAHHRAVGFTDFLILSNDCEDGSDAMLNRLAEMGEIAHMPNPAPHDGGVQWAAMKRADKHPLLKQADWILPLDIDEFVNIHAGDGSLPALLTALPEATAIPLTWRLFGNAGIVGYRDAPVPAQFTRAAPPVLHWPWQALMFKTLFRNDGTYRKLGVHRPRNPDPERLSLARWFDGEGRALPDLYAKERLFSAPGHSHYRLAQINHYALGAMESYLLKVARGRGVHGAERLGMDYWVERNFCDVEDRSVARYAAQTAAHRARLAADPELSRLHDAAVDWRQTRIAELLMQDDYRWLLGRLRMTPPARNLSTHDAAALRRQR